MARQDQSCTTKLAYPSKTAALKVLRGHRRRGPKYENRPLVAYRCLFCKQWHLGHKPSR